MKECPELEVKFEERVQEAVKYASTIEDFDELVDPRTLARHCLGQSLLITFSMHLIGKRGNMICLDILDHLFLFFLTLTLCSFWCKDDDQV